MALPVSSAIGLSSSSAFILAIWILISSALPLCFYWDLRQLYICLSLHLLCFSPSCPLFSFFSMSVVLLHTLQYLSPVSLSLLPPASKLELILMLAPSSLILLINAGKLLLTVISKVILGLIHFKSIQFIIVAVYQPQL